MENKFSKFINLQGKYLTSLLILLALSIGQMWAADPVENVGTYSTQVISADGTTSTWTFITPSSQVTIPTSPAETEDNDIIFHPGGGSKMKFSSSNGLSWSGNSDGYIYVPAGAAGSISMTVKSASDSRWLQLYVGGEDQGSTKRLWSKEANPATDARGPRTFTFTSSDLTTKGTKTYLHLKDNNTEMKIATFTVTLTTGNYLSSGPVDPTASFSDGAYTIGGADLDLSSLFTTNSDGAVTFTITAQGTTDAALRADGKSLYATTAGSATVKVEQAATSSYKAFNATATITVAACETSISGQPSNASLKVGDANPTLSVTAANVASYSWKESSDGTSYDGASELGSSASFTPAVNDAEQTKYYYCEVTSSCSGSAVVKSNIVTVEVEAADPPCAELVPATSGTAPTAGDAITLTTANGGSMKALTANISYTADGLLFGSSSSTKAEVTLSHLMQPGTIIRATIYNDNNDKNRGLNLLNSSGTSKATWTKNLIGDHVETYTVVAGDGLAGSNVFQLQRNNNAYLKSLTVSNCGAELFDLSSAVVPAGEATVTLSANKVIAGGSATASFTISDPTAYDFDEWVISSGDATIADAHDATAAITMGTTAATITLKLKAAGTKYAVHFDSKGGSAVADQLVEEGGHASVPTAPTKFKYTFGGWSETDGGSTPANLAEIAINAEKTFYAIWTDKVCPTSGTIFSLGMNGTKPSSEIKWTNAEDGGARDVSDYCDIVNGLAVLVNNSSSNNQVSITTTPNLKISNDANGWLKLTLECELAEGDIITLDNNNKCIISYTADKSEGTTYTLPNSSSHTYTVPATWAGEDELWFFRQGGGLNISSITIVRPPKYAVSFNMHGHGDQVATQNLWEGNKVTEPATTSITGWDFGGWYQTYVESPESYSNPWDFENDVVGTSAIELHAKWTAHVTSSDATLKDLTVNGVTVAGFDPATEEYNVVLEMGTTTTPEVGGVANDDNVISVVVSQTTDPADGATVTVTAEDNSTTKTYTINFSVATSKDIELVWDKSVVRCDATTPSAVVKSDDASVSAYINKITATAGGEGNSLNVGKNPGDMFTLSAKPGYAFKAMSFFGKIEDASCEFSLDGAAWQTLTSTNTGGNACYADVFSAAEVHELRMKITGSNGFWIRNMQLTMIEACTPVVITWDEEPVEFEVGKAGQAIAATANNGGTIAYGSSNGLIIAVDAGNGVLSVSDLGSVTLSASTAEGDGTTYCDNSGTDIVISKVVSTYFLVKFDAQNGEDPVEVKFHDSDIEVALPATAPSYPGHTFAGWFDAATGGNAVTAAFTPAASMTLYAHWTTDCDAPTIVEHPESANYFTGRTADALECQATAAGGNALTYKWYSCDDDQKTNPQELSGAPTPSTAAAGTFYFFCAVTEEGCGNVAYSNVAVITVADKDAICLVKAELAPGSSAASITSTSGYYKDDANIAININKDLKLGGTGKYVKVAVEGTNFRDGDVVEITLASDKTASAWLQIFTDEGTTMVAEMTSGVSREHPNYLTISGVPANTKTLYLYRTEVADGNMNPYPTSMAVYRTCAPILNKVTVASVDGTPDNTNHVAIEVPNSTLDDALDAIAYDWISNDAAWTADHEPAVANAWEWGVENTVTLTDKDGDASVYYVTISKAAPSTDATLSALTVNGQAVALVDGVFEYSVELPYGTTSAPTVAATANHVAATATVAAPTLSGASITVVPESGADDKQVYTLTFVISKWQEVVIWDGSYMTDVATSPGALGMAWEITGFGSVTNYTTTCADKSYAKVLPSGGSAGSSRSFVLNVPAGYVAKFYVVMASHSAGSERGMFIGSNLVKNPDATSVLELSTSSRDEAVAGTSEIVGAGTWYINPNNSIDFQEIRAYLRPGYKRIVSNNIGTLCVDHNVAAGDLFGATYYQIAGLEPEYGKIAFDEVTELVAGQPYIFRSNVGSIWMFYGETEAAAPVKVNGMVGSFAGETLEITEANKANIMYIAQNKLWNCEDLVGVGLEVVANRCYIDYNEVQPVQSQSPAPGRRRVSIGGANVPSVATDIDNLNASEKPVKLLIDGQLFIIRGEKMFDATGRLVK